MFIIENVKIKSQISTSKKIDIHQSGVKQEFKENFLFQERKQGNIWK